MKSYFSLNHNPDAKDLHNPDAKDLHNPDAKDLKRLSIKTGLSKRVLQVCRFTVNQNVRKTKF